METLNAILKEDPPELEDQETARRAWPRAYRAPLPGEKAGGPFSIGARFIVRSLHPFPMHPNETAAQFHPTRTNIRRRLDRFAARPLFAGSRVGLPEHLWVDAGTRSRERLDFAIPGTQ